MERDKWQKQGVNSTGIKVNADWGVDEVCKGFQKSTSHGRNRCQRVATSQFTIQEWVSQIPGEAHHKITSIAAR